jgi:ferrous-iron efflux pump FieF
MSADHAPGRRDARLNLLAGLASVTVALLLVGLKLWALGQTGSLAVAAALADSALDLLMSAGGLLAILYAAMPPDEDHAFGHSSAEDLAALAQSVLVLVAAGVIAVAALRRLLAPEPHPLEAEGAGIAVLAISVVLTGALVWWQRRVVRRTGNKIVAADALHYLGDLVPNLGGLVALAASALWGLARIDSVVALAASALMAIGALGLAKAALDALMDRRADPAVIAGIAAIARAHPGVLGFHDLKTRMSGSRIFVHIHIELDGRQTLEEAHAIGAALRRSILEAYPRADVIVHKDPAGLRPPPDDGSP